MALNTSPSLSAPMIESVQHSLTNPLPTRRFLAIVVTIGNIHGLGGIPLKQADGYTNVVVSQSTPNERVLLSFDEVNNIFRGPDIRIVVPPQKCGKSNALFAGPSVTGAGCALASIDLGGVAFESEATGYFVHFGAFLLDGHPAYSPFGLMWRKRAAEFRYRWASRPGALSPATLSRASQPNHIGL
jgi:hypothetical protein